MNYTNINLWKIFIRIKNKKLSEILFYIERKVIINFYKLLNIRPSSEPYLSGDTYKSFADCNYNGGQLVIKKPEIIFIKADRLEEFSIYVNNIKYPFVIISHHGDELVDEKYLSLLACENLLHWFAQNCILNHKKITPIPIGLEDRWYHNNGVLKEFKNLKNKKYNKIPRILVSFNVNTNPTIRGPALEKLQLLSTTDSFRGDSREYRKNLIKYMFVASPEGNGIDCHRTWEAIYLGVIPIVTNKRFHMQFEELPMLIINDWSELSQYTEHDLLAIYTEKVKKSDDINIIWSKYWKKQIKNKIHD